MRFLKVIVLCAAVFLSSCSNYERHVSVGKNSTSVTAPVSVTENLQTSLQQSDVRFVSQNRYFPLNFKVQKSVWISYIELSEMMTKKSQKEFEEAVNEVFQNVKKYGCNTVYVHVRPFGDAFYKSQVYPPTRFYFDRVNENYPYDALEIMVNQAHMHGLSIHAWINPLRCEKKECFEKYDGKFLIKKWYDSKEYNGKYLVSVDNSAQLWLNPAYSEVRELVCDGVREIVANYDVDGIHIDDYFYPTTDGDFDKDAFSDSTVASVSEFRIQNINSLIKEMYSTIKSENPDVLFGISPQGNISNNYTQLYADVKCWASQEGYCDYIVPQIYYGFENQYQPFEKVLQEWNDLACKDVSLVIGLAVYKIYENGEFSQNENIISQQIELSMSSENCDGIALYSYNSIFKEKNKTKSVKHALLQSEL